MSALLRALAAERIKLRGTLAARLCLIAPALVVALYVLQIAASRLPAGLNLDAAQAWQRYGQSVLVLWAFFMLPLFVTLQAALLASLEHGERQWKHLLALPLPRQAHYQAKLMALAAMLLAASLVLAVLVPLGGLALTALKPAFGLAGPPPWEWLLSRIFAIAAAAGLILAIQSWVAIRWRSFTVAVATGMSATVAGFLIGQSARFGHLYPWSMPLHAIGGEGDRMLPMIAAGLLGGLLVAALGLLDLLNREVD